MRILIIILLAAIVSSQAQAIHRHWTSADGLPNGEVQQIVELPNGQMLVNCEGVFCLSNGAGFDEVACDYGRCHQLPSYSHGYAQRWQGDSLLWLRDFYRIFLFDAHRRVFRYDIDHQIENDRVLLQWSESEMTRPEYDERLRQIIDSLGLTKSYSTVTQDRQGGVWIGTRNSGIVYVSPRSARVKRLAHGHQMISVARSYQDREGRIWQCKTEGIEVEEKGRHTLYSKKNVSGLPYNRTTFIQQLDEQRYLLCDSLATLGYFLPRQQTFVPLNSKLPQLNHYRHFVGACPIDSQWVVVYTQNGIFLLDTKADTLAPFIPEKEIGRYTSKYNCMAKDHEGRLWIGTQNGLFTVDRSGKGELTRVSGLRNNCIRSLVADRQGNLWAGTSCGISRITPSVINLGSEDGVPATSMMERAASLASDGSLVFVIDATQAVSICPDSIVSTTPTLPIVFTRISVNDRKVTEQQLTDLNYRQDHLTFQFSTLDYANPSHSIYRYRLYPIEKEWTVSSTGNGLGTATYAAMQPGRYRFEVEAAGPDGRWGTTTMVEIVITPPLWLTWWAKLCYVLSGMAMLLVMTSLYLKRRKERMERENDERVNQLFELRSEARYQFAQSVNINPQKISSTQQEEQLVEKLLKAIGQHMDDCDYTVDQLANDVAMSRASLYKKMQTMLGITPNEFMRNVRLKHAAKLLAETETPVNQVSLMVGFQTPRYFSQCFRTLFGVNPSDYRGNNPEPE